MSYYGLDALLVSSRARAAHAYRKRRHHLAVYDGVRDMPSERVPGRRERAQRRDTGPKGRVCVAVVRTRYVVVRDLTRTGMRGLTTTLSITVIARSHR